MGTLSDNRHWPTALRRHLQDIAIDVEDHVDTAWRRMNTRLGRHRPRHIAAYRGFADSRGVELSGRVLAEKPLGGPGEDDRWWDNLLNTYRRFESDEVAGAPLRLRFRDASFEVASDAEGYYTATFDTMAPPSDELWDNATVSLADGTLATPQPVLQVRDGPGIGVISDIDDTILHSGITDWKTAAQLTFLHNARTRKPLLGVAGLYQALQDGMDGACRTPIFYVSSSPWNLYDLLEDFMELNAIPPGPIFLRDLGLDTGKFIKTSGHGHKLERASRIIERFPQLRWVLLGDSGQADAELYAEAAHRFGERIAAIYIRDVDPGVDSPLDAGVDSHIERVAGTQVPMLRARDSLAMARHAASLSLIAPGAVAAIAREVGRDAIRPTIAEAAVDDAVEARAQAGARPVIVAPRSTPRPSA
jgi:phosphatidate phosphatase APP1